MQKTMHKPVLGGDALVHCGARRCGTCAKAVVERSPTFIGLRPYLYEYTGERHECSRPKTFWEFVLRIFFGA